MHDDEIHPGSITLTEAAALPEDADWTGPTIRYDLVKEVTVAVVVVAMLAMVLALFFGSPDDAPVTIRQWSNAKPGDFLATALSELDGSSGSAGYGPPYNTAGTGQELGPVSAQQIVGVHIPLDTVNDFILAPLRQQAASTPAVGVVLAQWSAASSDQQTTWMTNYGDALPKGNQTGTGAFSVPPADDGPLPGLLSALLTLADSGALDADLTSSPNFYGTDYTKPLLFLSDSGYLADKGKAQNLSGSQWGMMNETGSYPGQAWLWLYTMWYQIPPMKTSHNADVEVWAIMMGFSLLLVFVPFIPGLRDIPRFVPVYRLVWQDHYRRLAAERVTPPAGSPPD